MQQEEEAVLAQSAEGSQGKKDAMEIAEEARGKYVMPSFGSQLFMGDFNPSLLTPFPEQSAADKKIGDDYIRTLTHFLTENLDPEEVDRTREIPKEVINGLVKLGAFALKIPKEYGGLGIFPDELQSHHDGRRLLLWIDRSPFICSSVNRRSSAA